MIGYLSGTIQSILNGSILLNVNGVGYKVNVDERTWETLPDQGQETSLWIYSHIREDDIKLFGFLNEADQALFEKLISINGVGPRMALSILSKMNSDQLTSAVFERDIVQLSSVPGVGKKTAERICIDMKDKLDRGDRTDPIIRKLTPAASSASKQALSALINLGYNRLMAERAVQSIQADPNLSLEDTIRASLTFLSKGL